MSAIIRQISIMKVDHVWNLNKSHDIVCSDVHMHYYLLIGFHRYAVQFLTAANKKIFARDFLLYQIGMINLG